MKKVSIVLGAGFGDEGKGNFVNHLCKETPGESLVIRFNGGHQAGHTVLHNGHRHIFSNFGAGTLQNVPTFWSKYCTIYPPGFLREFESLSNTGFSPKVFVDPMCPVTTPFDIHENRKMETVRQTRHGSCGVGFGQTVYRHEALDHSYRLFAKDLFNPWILRNKLQSIMQFYNSTMINPVDRSQEIEPFMIKCRRFLDIVQLRTEYDVITGYNHPRSYEHLIFEGAQGILLDREHGIFPHVTRSHTTSKNVMEILGRLKMDVEVDRYYMTRCYSTRHGNGPFFIDKVCPNNSDETNQSNEYQGDFKISPFYRPNLDYAILSDRCYDTDLKVSDKIVVTCMDQFTGKIPILKSDMETIEYKYTDDFIDMFPKNTIFVNKPDF